MYDKSKSLEISSKIQYNKAIHTDISDFKSLVLAPLPRRSGSGSGSGSAPSAGQSASGIRRHVATFTYLHAYMLYVFCIL